MCRAKQETVSVAGEKGASRAKIDARPSGPSWPTGQNSKTAFVVRWTFLGLASGIYPYMTIVRLLDTAVCDQDG